MSAFNKLHVPLLCANCGKAGPFVVQFVFGSIWQYDYRMGDRLRWGESQEGRPGLGHVIVQGIVETCPQCGFDGEWYMHVHIEHDIVTRLEPADGSMLQLAPSTGWYVLQE